YQGAHRKSCSCSHTPRSLCPLPVAGLRCATAVRGGGRPSPVHLSLPPPYCAVPDRLDDCVPAESGTGSVAVCTEPAASLLFGTSLTEIVHVAFGARVGCWMSPVAPQFAVSIEKSPDPLSVPIPILVRVTVGLVLRSVKSCSVPIPPRRADVVQLVGVSV